MTVTFHIQYYTEPGQQLAVELLSPLDGNGLVVMQSADNHNWTASIDLKSTDCQQLQYRYKLIDHNSTLRSEWGKPHSLTFDAKLPCNRISVYDYWQDMPANKPYYSRAFTQSIFRRDTATMPLSPAPGCILLGIMAPMVKPDETLVLTGNCQLLGEWHVDNAIAMNDALYPLWQTSLPLEQLPEHVEYKAVIVKRDNPSHIVWEDGDNRTLTTGIYDNSIATVVNSFPFRQTAMNWRGTGVAIPVFSLRTRADYGIGDFMDLIQLIDWAEMTGQNVVQILPVNDTAMSGTWMDSYPYNANSTFALNPVYLRLDAMGVLPDQRMDYYRAEADKLNSLKAIDYVAAAKLKLSYTHELFNQEYNRIVRDKNFKQYILNNESWLRPYAAWCTLRDIYHTADFSQWQEHATFTPQLLETFEKKNGKEMRFVYFQQYHLHKQLTQVREYARQHHVAIKGDIPIGIARTSVDAWLSPRLFNLDCQAGAPPDDFSVLGQNWGFPTYNWEEMKRDNYAWWKSRFTKMAEYFDAYRIDHVLGFFRIWQIPSTAVDGLLGYFNPALPLTPGEIIRDYGLTFNPTAYATAHVSQQGLEAIAGYDTTYIANNFLELHGEHYYPKAQYDTQRKVVNYFASLESSEHNVSLCRKMLNILDEVLLIEDGSEKGKYHPRIALSQTQAYKELDSYHQRALDLLHENFFYHRHNDFWRDVAMEKLPNVVEATDMLACAEDLGMIPACVPDVMNRLLILSLEIQRMPKEFGVEFGDTHRYPYLSVCTTSTHDMPGIRQWWEDNHEAANRYYHTVLGHANGEAPYFAEPYICREIIDLHLKSPSMLCILPLQDWLSMYARLRRDNPREEQINNPANSRHYWRYRMHLPLEELIDHTDFTLKRL